MELPSQTSLSSIKALILAGTTLSGLKTNPNIAFTNSLALQINLAK